MSEAETKAIELIRTLGYEAVARDAEKSGEVLEALAWLCRWGMARRDWPILTRAYNALKPNRAIFTDRFIA